MDRRGEVLTAELIARVYDVRARVRADELGRLTVMFEPGPVGDEQAGP